MARGDKYFYAVCGGLLVFLLLNTLGVTHIDAQVLQCSWVVSLVLPLVVPAMARQLDMAPILTQFVCYIARRLVGKRGV